VEFDIVLASIRSPDVAELAKAVLHATQEGRDDASRMVVVHGHVRDLAFRVSFPARLQMAQAPFCFTSISRIRQVIPNLFRRPGPSIHRIVFAMLRHIADAFGRCDRTA